MLETLIQLIDIKPIKPLVYLVNKPIGFSSYTIVDIFKRSIKDKVGHAGTLDPLAQGDLLLLVGPATKLANQYLQTNKYYQTTILLGAKTQSADLETSLILQKTQLSNYPKNKLATTITKSLQKLQTIKNFKVTHFSALKNKGVPMYKHKNNPFSLFKEKSMQLIDFTVNHIKKISSKDLADLIQNKINQINKSAVLYKQITTKLSTTPRKQQTLLFDNLLKIVGQNKKIILDSNITFVLVTVDMHVTSGTYVRTLTEYLATILKTPATTIDIIRHNSYN